MVNLMEEVKERNIEIRAISLSSVLKNLLPTVFIVVFILLFFCGLVVLKIALKFSQLSDIGYLNNIGLSAGTGFWVIVFLSFLYSIIFSFLFVFLILLVIIFYNMFVKIVGGIKFTIREQINTANISIDNKGEIRQSGG
ncbi:MAG: DUF3566 domain-containing protein [Candidatus Marinimicrobia bacterium]|nr:DUF3566 domain-containing protein [Candidatus Neomarinimicrobiota bacterium]